MRGNYDENIVSGFLNRVSRFWLARSVGSCQNFMLAGSVGLISLIVFFFGVGDSSFDSVFNLIILCFSAVLGYVFFKARGANLSAFTFVCALLLRLCLVFLLENSSAYMLESVSERTNPWIKHYDSLLFQPDEYYYVYHGRLYSDLSLPEFLEMGELQGNSDRSSFFVSRLFRFFGDDILWIRLFGGLLGSLAAAMICLASKEIFEEKLCAVISLFCIAAPQSAFYSVRMLKEVWVIFAVSLMIYATVLIIRNKRFFEMLVCACLAFLILIWVRFEYALIFAMSISIAFCFRHRSSVAGRTVLVFSVIVFGVAIFGIHYNRLAHKAEYIFDKYTVTEHGLRGRFEFVDKVYQSRGMLRVLNVPISFLNPLPKNIHQFYTSEKKLYNIVQLGDIYQWWLPLPFLLLGSHWIFRRYREFFSVLIPYLTAVSVSAVLLGGLQVDFLRYRDSLVPMAFLITGFGIQGFLKEPAGWKNKTILGVYGVFVLLAAYFYIRDFC